MWTKGWQLLYVSNDCVCVCVCVFGTGKSRLQNRKTVLVEASLTNPRRVQDPESFVVQTGKPNSYQTGVCLFEYSLIRDCDNLLLVWGLFGMVGHFSTLWCNISGKKKIFRANPVRSILQHPTALGGGAGYPHLWSGFLFSVLTSWVRSGRSTARAGCSCRWRRAW